jgi:membrane fusion protein, multidrug efflux system
VQVELVSGKPEAKIVVPPLAPIADQHGIYVFVVEEDGKAAIRRIKTGGESVPDVVVESGLSGGEQIIVEGLP